MKDKGNLPMCLVAVLEISPEAEKKKRVSEKNEALTSCLNLSLAESEISL